MKSVKILSALFALLMFLSISYGLVFSDFSREGKELLDLTWGVITLIDIYIMFLLFSLWVIYREGVNLRSSLIVILVMLLGSLTASIYALYALQKSKGNWKLFWLGKNANKKNKTSPVKTVS